jgi:hypothetical protein
MRACHVLYVSATLATRLDEVLARIVDGHVLSVSDVAEFARRGGVARITVVDGRTRIEINSRAAASAGLRISSQLLKLATIVEEP